MPDSGQKKWSMNAPLDIWLNGESSEEFHALKKNDFLDFCGRIVAVAFRNTNPFKSNTLPSFNILGKLFDVRYEKKIF